ncbi:MAG: PepSY-associated TM helix domain-containing protein [Steroidobacteraceae bacterium]
MSLVPGSLFRRILFWAHLACGVVAGVLILVMSVTGVLLTYERQMQESAARGNRVVATAGQTRLSIDALAAAAQAAVEPNPRLTMVIDADPQVPVGVSAGRGNAALLNPYTGEKLVDAAEGTRGFMSLMRRWHRWLGADSSSVGAVLIDYANLLFVFIVVSGIYLWLPQVWRWRTVRGLLFFQRRYINGKVRDFNWHHVFGIWMLIPLFLIALSGVVMSFPWASNLVYAAYGEKAPQRGGGGGAGGAAERPRPRNDAGDAATPRVTLQQLFDSAVSQAGNWQKVTMPVHLRGAQVDIPVELQSSERRAPRRTVTVATADGSVQKVDNAEASAAAVQTPGQKARGWFRRVHTGEQYGVVGQTIAGLASLAACFLVYTGLALAYRRLLRPLFRRTA